MLVVCGNSVNEIRENLAIVEQAIASGATMGCGGLTLADAKKALKMLTDYVGSATPCSCGCPNCCHPDLDPEIEECPDDYTVDELIEILRARANGECPDELVDWGTDEIARAIIENI